MTHAGEHEGPSLEVSEIDAYGLFALGGGAGGEGSADPGQGIAERAVRSMCSLILLSTTGVASASGGSDERPADLAAAIDQQIEDTAASLRELTRRSTSLAGTTFLFAQGVVFVSGRLLRAGRATYDEVMQVGMVLDRCGISEVAVAKDIFTSDLKTFATLLQGFYRNPEPVVPERITPRIRLRPVNDAARRYEAAGEQDLAGDAAIVHTYASAIVLMRRFFEGLKRGRYQLPKRFRRIAQKLVDLSAGETPAFLGVTAARNANHDEAGRAVNTAVLSLAMARQITSDVLMLERLAMAALLYDTARPRLTAPSMIGGEGGASILPDLTDDQDAEVPPATAAVMTALGKVTEASVIRTVLAYEAQWVKRNARLGPLYRGLRPPLLQARIIAVARAFNDLLTPASGRDALAADGAIATLEEEAEGAADRTVLRLLIGALGIFPTGTLVELSTGEVALVIQTPSHPALYSHPRVRLVFDASGGPLDRVVEIDLAQAPPTGEPARHIRRVVATSDDAAASTMRSFASHPGSGASASSARHGPTSSNASRGPQRTPARPTSKAGSPPPPVGREHSGETPVSRSRRTESPPTPPTVPASSLSSRDTPDSDQGAVRSTRSASLHGSSGSAPPSRRQDPSVPWVSGGEEGGSPVTRELPWHNRAFLLLAEQVEKHRATDPSAAPRRRSERALTTAPAPSADGTLTKTPLIHLLVYMLDRGLTGTTIFQTPTGASHAIYFHEGAPAKVRTGSTIAPFDEVILELGLLEEETLLEALAEAQEQKILLGRYLVAQGMLDRETLLSVLNMQLVRKLIALFKMERETQYAYYDGLNLLDGYAGSELFSCEPLAVVMAGIRAAAQEQIVNATLDRIGQRAIMLHPEGDVRRFRFHADEGKVAELIRRQRMTVVDILRSGVASERTVRLTLYGLAITRHLDVGGVARAPVGVVGGDSAADIDPASLRSGPIILREAPSASREVAPQHATSSASSGSSAAVSPPSHTPANPPRTPPRTPVATPIAVRSAPPAVVSAGQGMFTPLAGPTESQGPGSPADASPDRAPAQEASPFARGLGESSSKNARPDVDQAPVSARDRAGSRAGSQADLSASASIAERRAEIERRAASIDKEDYFTVLGVTRESAPAEIQAAYFALAKRWHPDRIQGELADSKPLVGRVFARVTDAFRTLSDPTKRAEYIRLRDEPSGSEGEHDVVARAVDAALEFQKAEVLLKKNDLAGAEALAKRAVLADPEQADYVTLLVWIQALRRGNPPPVREGRSTGFYDDLIKTLDGVLAKEPMFERALFYRGTLLKRSGRLEKALADFRKVVQVNPRNIDAAREVRLAGMRARAAGIDPTPQRPAKKGQSPTDDDNDPPDDGGGLFNKLFKR